MSLLLSSLKKADEQSRKPAESVASAPVEAAATSASAPQSGAAIDFDSVADAGGTGGSGVESGERRELVSATRVFRAGEGGGEGDGNRFIIGIVAVLFVVGAGAGVVVSGIIPGVNVGAVLGILGKAEPVQVVERQEGGPLLEVVGGDDASLSLPRPLVDIQSGIVEFTGFRGGDEANETLDTPQSRRELADKIRGFVAEAAAEDALIEEEEDDLQIIGLGIEGETIEAEEDIEIEQAIKTAEASRNRKLQLDSRTPSDRLLSDAIKNNAPVEVTVAQSSESDAESAGSVESGAATEFAPVLADEVESAGGGDAAPADSAQEEIQVRPSLDGADRRRMLNEAGRLYVGGAYPEAEATYRNVLSANATNRDALRGLALVAVATGRYQLAVATYLKILEYYPNDPVAVADLTNLHGVSGENFYAIESALKKVLGEHPEWDSRLHFALGNLYAGGERWLDAQKSYFNAYSGEPGNPDYAYNLAVVLDYLNKPGLAARYYREALNLSESAPSGFDAGQVRERIAVISQ